MDPETSSTSSQQEYVIRWEHRVKHTKGESKKKLSLSEAMVLCKELNDEFGDTINHWIWEAGI